MNAELNNDTNNNNTVEQAEARNEAKQLATSGMAPAPGALAPSDPPNNPTIPESTNPDLGPDNGLLATDQNNTSLSTGNSPLFGPSRGRGQRPRLGKVAQLPPDIREWVNLQLLDDVPYDAILDELDDRGHGHITRQNLTNWRSCGGYEQWLSGHMARQERRSHLEIISSYISQCRGRVDEAAMLILSGQLLSLVSDYDPNSFRKHLDADPKAYLYLIQAVARLGKVRQASSKIASASLAGKASGNESDLNILPDAERGLTEETLKKITDAIRLF